MQQMLSHAPHERSSGAACSDNTETTKSEDHSRSRGASSDTAVDKPTETPHTSAGLAAQAVLLVVLIAGARRDIPDYAVGLACTICAMVFLAHESSVDTPAAGAATSSQIKGADVLCEFIMFSSDCFASDSSGRLILDVVAVLLNLVNSVNFLRTRWRGGEWWTLCEAVNSATDGIACWLEAAGLESEASENACTLVLACIAALLLADEVRDHVKVRRQRWRLERDKKDV